MIQQLTEVIKNCNGCGACVVGCKDRCVKMVENEEGENVMNEETMREITCYAEPLVQEAEAGERFQFFRHGYFVADSKLHTKEAPVFNEIVGLKSSWK